MKERIFFYFKYGQKVEVMNLFWELRELFNYATPLVIMLSLYMFQFTMLFTS